MTSEHLLISQGFVPVLKHTKIYVLIFAVMWMREEQRLDLSTLFSLLVNFIASYLLVFEVSTNLNETSWVGKLCLVFRNDLALFS